MVRSCLLITLIYSSGSQLEWREVGGGQFPSPRMRLRATLVGDILFLAGGYDDDYNRCNTTTSPQSSPGNRLLSPCNQLETSLWGDPTMQLSPFQNQLLNVNCKLIQYITQHWQF